MRAALPAALLVLTARVIPVGARAADAPIHNPAISAITADHSRANVGLIVQTTGAPDSVRRSVAAAGWPGRARLPTLLGFAATVSRAEADRLNHDPRVARLDENARVELLGSAVRTANLVSRAHAIIRTPGAWDRGYDGTEVQVAVLDSGVYPHDDLTQKSPYVPANVGNRLMPVVVNPNATDAIDHVGHGTHVAGILAGNGYDSAGKYIGVAPNSLVVGVKVSDDAGNVSEGDVITGLEWVFIANTKGLKIRVVNLSLASTAVQSYNTSALDAMVEKLWLSGVTVVVSAGSGVGAPLSAPGNDPYVISVGSIGRQLPDRQDLAPSWHPGHPTGPPRMASPSPRS